MKDFDHKFLTECLDYDKDTGVFTWKADRPDSHFHDWRSKTAWNNNISEDRIAGSPSPVTDRNPTSYLLIGLNGKTHRAHRLAWFYVNGEWPEGDIDHINQNTLDNRIDNLRISVDAINHRNRSKYKNNKSGMSGLSFNKKLNKWQAEGQQVVEGKRIRHYLGVHADFFEACCVRKSWEVKYRYSPEHGKCKGVLNE